MTPTTADRPQPGFNLLNTARDVNVTVNVEFKVTLHEQVRYRGTLQSLQY